MVTSLSALEDNRRLIAQTPMVAALAKQMTDLKEISREVYKALINLAEHEELCQCSAHAAAAAEQGRRRGGRGSGTADHCALAAAARLSDG
jgi:hypothetical protein